MNFLESVSEWFSFAGKQFAGITFRDILDILFLSLLFYALIKFVRDRRAAKLLIGLVPLFLLYFVSFACDFYAIAFVLRSLAGIGLLAAIIVFQPEIRAALDKIGEEFVGLFSGFGKSKDTEELRNSLTLLCDAVCEMSRTKTGALIVIERSTKLGDLMETGVYLDAVLSSKLLRNLFFNKAPLHDGAVILRHMRIAAAGCVLPNTAQTSQQVANLGTRHRAAIGASEISDAVVIVVSEETGTISMALGGKIYRDFGFQTLRSELMRLLVKDENGENKDGTAGTEGEA